MKSLLKNILILALAMLPLTAFADDEVTVTSYSPSPEGDYQRLRTSDKTSLAVDNTATSRVGIGTETPQAKLDVRGTFKLADGSEGQDKVLTSNATGVASWQNGVVTVSDEIVCTNNKDKDKLVICTLGDLTEWKACYLTALSPTTSSGSWDAGCVILGHNGNFSPASMYSSDPDRRTTKWQIGTKASGGDGVVCSARCIK